MRRIAMSLVVVLTAFSASICLAGWTTVPSYSQGYLTIPGVGNFYSWKNPRSDMTACAEIVLNPGNSFAGNEWRFQVNQEETSEWTMSFCSSIWLNTDQESFDPIETATSVKGHVSLALTVRMFLDRNMGEDNLLRSYTLSDFLLAPSRITGTTLAYDHRDVNCGGLISTNWLLDYQVSGEFVAGSLTEARAMGVQFVSTPEPGTMVLLVSALLVLGSTVLFRR